MAKPNPRATPDNRVDRWKKLWGTPKPMSDEAVTAAFDEFRDSFVPSHMHKQFMKLFGVPKAPFGNRFFVDEAAFKLLDTRISTLVSMSETHCQATIIYGTPDTLEGWTMRGETRRTLKDLFVDDWFAACAIITAGDTTVYAFIEPKMKGSVLRAIRGEVQEEEEPELREFEADSE